MLITLIAVVGQAFLLKKAEIDLKSMPAIAILAVTAIVGLVF